MDLKKKYNIKTISYSKSLENSIRKINKNKDLKKIIQKINILNSNVLGYNQIENLLKSDLKHKEEKGKNSKNLPRNFKTENNSLKKLEKNKTYENVIEKDNKSNSLKAINIEKSLKKKKISKFNSIEYKYNVKDELTDYFKEKNKKGKGRIKLFPLFNNKSSDILSISSDLEYLLVFLLNLARLSRIELLELSIRCVCDFVMQCGSVTPNLLNAMS